MFKNKLVKIGLIILAGVVVLYLVNSYNSENAVVDQVVEEQFAAGGSCGHLPKEEEEGFYGGHKKCGHLDEEEFTNYDEMDDDEEDKVRSGFVGFREEKENFENRNSAGDVKPSDESNEVQGTVNHLEKANPVSNQLPKDCYPKDQLSPEELLPGNENSKWAQSNPKGKGELGDQNFLTAGYHIGVNTVGQSLRNANLQLRSEPPNPQIKVSPWLQSTIEPDTNRKPLEIGGCS